eukprot:4421468-Amphidinium_carterae.1
MNVIKIEVYTDRNFAGCVETRISSSSRFVFMGDHLFERQAQHSRYRHSAALTEEARCAKTRHLHAALAWAKTAVRTAARADPGSKV